MHTSTEAQHNNSPDGTLTRLTLQVIFVHGVREIAKQLKWQPSSQEMKNPLVRCRCTRARLCFPNSANATLSQLSTPKLPHGD